MAQKKQTGGWSSKERACSISTSFSPSPMAIRCSGSIPSSFSRHATPAPLDAPGGNTCSNAVLTQSQLYLEARISAFNLRYYWIHDSRQALAALLDSNLQEHTGLVFAAIASRDSNCCSGSSVHELCEHLRPQSLGAKGAWRIEKKARGLRKQSQQGSKPTGTLLSQAHHPKMNLVTLTFAATASIEPDSDASEKSLLIRTSSMPGSAVVSVAESPRAVIASGLTSWMRSSVSMRIIFWKPAAPGAPRNARSGPTHSGVGSP